MKFPSIWDVWPCYGSHGPIDTFDGAWNRLHCDTCSPESKKSAQESMERQKKEGKRCLNEKILSLMQ